MTFDGFNRLSGNSKEELISREGTFIAIRQEPEFIIRLYQLDSFYVECYYHRIKSRPVSIRSFIHPDQLDPYINGIDLGFVGLV